MKKRILCALLALLTAVLLVLPALAAESDSGKCGEDVYWSLDDTDTLTISGTGEMDAAPDYLTSWHARIRAVVVEEGGQGGRTAAPKAGECIAAALEARGLL